MIYPRQPRSALTLIEILVVIAIIGVLIGLLLPAVQMVRDAANKVTCTNNLKQLVLAAHGYHDTHKHLPRGVPIQKGDSPVMGWQGLLLPYLDQGPMWKGVQRDHEIGLSFGNPKLTTKNTFVPTFICPGDTVASKPRPIGPPWGFTSYLGISGISGFRQSIGLESPPAGVLYLNSRVSFPEITDGLSNTLFVGERMVADDRTFGHWYHAYGWYGDGTANAVLGVEEGEVDEMPTGRVCKDAVFRPGRSSEPCDQFHFWSSHVGGGTNFAFCDGSVRFFRYTSRNLLPALATRAMGEIAIFPE